YAHLPGSWSLPFYGDIHARLITLNCNNATAMKKGRGVCRALRPPERKETAQKSMSPMPAPGPGTGGVFFFGISATIASVVMSRPATEDASCSAVRTTLVGSMMPFDTRLT